MDGSAYLRPFAGDAPDRRDDRKAAYRKTLAQFATGVTIVSCMTADRAIHAMTVNSFTSISLEPPLVLWSLRRSSRRCSLFREAQNYSISILTKNQSSLADLWAKGGPGQNSLAMSQFDGETLLVKDCLAGFECTRHQTIDAGDHTMVLGRVMAFHHNTEEPLIYFDGSYHSVAM